MKVKVNWKELGKQLWEAVKPVLLVALGGGLVTLADGCSSLNQTPRGQTTEIVARPLATASRLGYASGCPSESLRLSAAHVGIPAIAWISHTSQDANHGGSDTNGVSQANSSDVPVSVNLGK